MKKTPLLPMTTKNRFERSCSTFRERGRKDPLLSTTLGYFARIFKLIINDHGLDVNIIMVI
jgi:hypothetical protein